METTSRRHIRQLREHLSLLPAIKEEIRKIEWANYQSSEDKLKLAYLNHEKNRIRLILAQMQCREADLYFGQGKSLYQISVLCNRSFTTINNRINRAIKAYLKQQLNP